ncbi:hypothetical protein LG293_16020 (plasmid) [Citricoccus nitrophenolicus]
MSTPTPRRARRRPTQTFTALAGLLAGAVLLAGCADSVRSTEATASSAPETASQPSPEARKVSHDDVVSAWELATGDECQQGESDFQSELHNAHRVVSCDEDTLIASFWAADAQPAAHELLGKALGPDEPDHVLLTGDRWSAFVAAEDAEVMQAEIGGEVDQPEYYEQIQVTKVGDLVDAWETATGKDCGATPADRELQVGGTDCAGLEVSLTMYESQSEIDQMVEDVRSLTSGEEELYWLIGEHWVVNADQEFMEELQYVIGGELVPLH